MKKTGNEHLMGVSGTRDMAAAEFLFSVTFNGVCSFPKGHEFV